MPTPRGDPQGSSKRPGGGLWGALWKRLGGVGQAAPRQLAATDSVSSYSREALQAMIERKRHNDFMRHREFDSLRKLRRSDGGVMSGLAVHPVPFHSSVPSGPGERATTLKKIDEIEAQMSIQWRRVKAREPVPSRVSARPAPAPDAAASGLAGALSPDTEHLSTHASPSRRAFASVLAVTLAAPDAAASAPDGEQALSTQPAASTDTMQFVPDPDPEIEEAALRFAGGDAAGAETALLALLAPGHPRSSQPETWLVLFDLYRATGQQAAYEDHAVHYAERFQRSPPQWRRLCEPRADAAVLAGMADRASTAPAAGGAPARDWSCPPVLNGLAVSELRHALVSLPQPWRLSWDSLAAFESDALPGLAQLVAQWARQPVRLQCAGIERLERILDARTACGDRGGDPLWWVLRLDWLRALRRGDEFELVAIDYCITYEVSPPAWEPPLCDVQVIRAAGESGGDTGLDALEPKVPALGASEWGALSSFGATIFTPPAAGELAGTLLGDLAADLARLDAQLQDAELFVVSCARLERIDFEAAGHLANWVSARQAEGRAIHLAEVHRLVAALMGAMGLATQARITLRRD